MTGRLRSGVNINEPAAAQGTTEPSMPGSRGGPPHATYPCALSEALIPHTSSR